MNLPLEAHRLEFQERPSSQPQAELLALDPLPERTAAQAPLAVGGSTNPLLQVKAQLQVCVGQATISVGELLAAKRGHVIALDRKLDEVVDVLLEGQVVARGQLVAVDDVFGIRITELPLPLAP